MKGRGFGRLVIFLLLMGVAGGPPAWAQLPPLIPRELLFGAPARLSPQLSPDGRYVAFLAPAAGVLHLWVQALEDTAPPRQLTSGRRRDLRWFFWQPDSKGLLFLDDAAGEENFALYQVPLHGGAARLLTPFPGVKTEVLALSPHRPREVLLTLNRRDRRLRDVYRLDLLRGTLKLDTVNPGDVYEWGADRQLRVRAALARRPDGGGALRVRSPGGRWRTLLGWGPEDTLEWCGFDHQGRRVYVISGLEGNTTALVEVELRTRTRRVLAVHPHYDLDYAVCHPRHGTPEVVHWLTVRRLLQGLSDAAREDLARLRERFGPHLELASQDFSGRRWLVAVISDQAPRRYYLYDRQSQTSRFLFSDRPALADYPLAEMHPLTLRARDGLLLSGYLLLPPGVPPRHLPLVVRVHAGPWLRHVWGLSLEAQWLANRGYAVVQVNFRGSAGFGKAFLNAGTGEWGRKMLEDLIDARRWAVAQGLADPRRTAIMGASYGGYAVLSAAAFSPEEFQCGVALAGPANLLTLLTSLPPDWTVHLPLFHRRVGHPDTAAALLKARSPLFHTSAIRMPLLIAHGGRDPRVRLEESEALVAALRREGKPVEYLVFPDEGHFLQQRGNRLTYYAAVEHFLARFLGGRAEAAPHLEQVGEIGYPGMGPGPSHMALPNGQNRPARSHRIWGKGGSTACREGEPGTPESPPPDLRHR